MKKMAVLMAMTALVVAIPVLAADCDISQEPEGICLYSEHSFPKGAIGEGIIALNFLVPGKIAKEEGFNGVWEKIAEMIFSRYVAKDQGTNFDSYLVGVAVYGNPPLLLEEELQRSLFELLFLLRQIPA